MKNNTIKYMLNSEKHSKTENVRNPLFAPKISISNRAKCCAWESPVKYTAGIKILQEYQKEIKRENDKKLCVLDEKELFAMTHKMYIPFKKRYTRFFIKATTYCNRNANSITGLKEEIKLRTVLNRPMPQTLLKYTSLNNA